jgi:hypothetical protein
MSASGRKAENICSYRVFRLLTPQRTLLTGEAVNRKLKKLAETML